MSRPERIPVSLGKRSYDIILGRGILTEIGEQLEGLELGRRCAVLSDSNLGSTYGRIVADGLSRAGYEAYLLEIPAGEGSKTLAQTGDILDALVQCGPSLSTSVEAWWEILADLSRRSTCGGFRTFTFRRV